MSQSGVIPAEPIPPKGATAFPPPTRSLAAAPQGPPKLEALMDMDITPEGGEGGEGGGGRKRKNHRSHHGPKRRKLNLHNSAPRTLQVSARTPVRILMELGQQQKFEVEYQFSEPPARKATDPADEMVADQEEADGESTEEGGTGAGEGVKQEDNGGKSEEKANEENGDNQEETAENGDEEEKDTRDFGFWSQKRQSGASPFSAPFSPRFSCTCTMRGEVYSGSGRTKQLAKNMAAEQAIKALALREPASTAPWQAMACLGMYKVFTEWEGQGADLEHLVSNTKMVPTPQEPKEEERAPQPIAVILSTPNMVITEPVKRDRRERKKEKMKKEGPKVAGRMPTNPTSRHPVQLLNELHPGMDFVFTVGNGENNYECKVNVETLDFHCKGKRNKKEAKKGVALEALKVLYNVTYPPGNQFA